MDKLDTLFDDERNAFSVVGEAETLLSLWENVRRQHRPAPVGCSCGVSVPHITARDFEADLVDFVAARHASVEKLIEPSATIPCLLATITSGTIADDTVKAIIGDLRRAIISFAASGRTYDASRA